MTLDEMIAVLMAAKDGKVIQFRNVCGWEDAEDVYWNFRVNEYRVKPEPEVVGFYAWKASDGYVVNKLQNPNLELEFIDGKLTGAKVL